MNKVYIKYLKDLEEENKSSDIYKIFLNNESKEYKENNDNKRIVIDFIAGMTDDFFLKEIESC
jgi:dGTPase